MSHGLNRNEFEDSYRIYRWIRDSKNIRGLRIKIDIAEKELNILEKELKLTEALIYGK